MSNTDVAKFFAGHQIPNRENLTKAIAGFASNRNALLGKALLRFSKQGFWCFGIDNEKLENGTQIIVNPASMSSGYVAWWLSKIENEIMQPLSMGPVDVAKLGPVNSGSIPPGKDKPSGKGWESQGSFDAVTRGEVPVTLIYKTSSLGGMKAIMGLAADIAIGLQTDVRRVYPVVELGSDSYNHSEYGEVFTPELNVVGWLDEAGEEVVEILKLDKKNLL